MTEPVVFDRAAALRRLLSSEKLLREVIGIFLRDLPRVRTGIAQALTQRSASALRLAVHGLKGSASQVGGNAVVHRAWRVEQFASSDNLADAEQLIPLLLCDLDELVRILEAELDTMPRSDCM